MEWRDLQPIYDSVMGLMYTTRTVDALPGSEDVHDFMVNHIRDMGPILLCFHHPQSQVQMIQNTLYIGLLVGLLYCQQYGIPEWAVPLLERGNYGESA